MSATAFQRARRMKDDQQQAAPQPNEQSPIEGQETSKLSVATIKSKKAGDSDAGR